MAKAGRKTVMTEEVCRKIEEVAALDGSVEEMCYYADVSRDAYYDYIKKNPAFADRIEKLRSRPVLKARQTIVKSLDNPQQAQWYLERKKKLEFAQKQEVEHSGTIKTISEALNEIENE